MYVLLDHYQYWFNNKGSGNNIIGVYSSKGLAEQAVKQYTNSLHIHIKDSGDGWFSAEALDQSSSHWIVCMEIEIDKFYEWSNEVIVNG
ncbi:MAG: hypothetical protein ACYTBJ_25450 [Planctomycetota bacterium]|jgi:hypothetical protein